MPLDKIPLVDGFFKVKKTSGYMLSLFCMETRLFPDVVLALTPSVDETVPWIMYWRESFTGSRRLLLIQWLIMGNVISHVYKGALLSDLIKIRYTEPLDTITQMEQSGIPFYCLGNTALCWLARTDPRDAVVKLTKRLFEMPYSGKVDDQYLEE